MSSNKEFGSVFKSAANNGPRRLPAMEMLPSWPDRRLAGSTNYNEQASDIMRRWDPQKMKRFEYWFSSFYENLTPWKKEWLDKTAPNYRKPEQDILKCKIELIKRILKIKVLGPESMEDWCLLFLVHENELVLPQNMEQLIKPPEANSRDLKSWLSEEQDRNTYNYAKNYIEHPSLNMLKYPGNMPIPGFGSLANRDVPNDRPFILGVPYMSRRNQAELRNRYNEFPRFSASAANRPNPNSVRWIDNLNPV